LALAWFFAAVQSSCLQPGALALLELPTGHSFCLLLGPIEAVPSCHLSAYTGWLKPIPNDITKPIARNFIALVIIVLLKI
jgi:hypothetical protein